jgi:Holliday junction DNA helicase RuvB
MTEDPLGPPPDPTEASVLSYFHSHPALVRPTRDALVWAKRHPAPFTWWEAKVIARQLDRLTLDGILDRVSGGRYKFRDEDAVARAIVRYVGEVNRLRAEAANPSVEFPRPIGAPPNIFADIVGYETVKRQVLRALTADEPVHVLLWGSPSTGKSLFLEGIQSIPGTVTKFADAVSRAGLRRFLLSDEQRGSDAVRVLCLDELDKMPEEDTSALLEILERQRVSMLVTGVDRDEAVNVRVFAAANRIDRMPPELLSRFHKIQIVPYTVEEFIFVATQHLLKRKTPPNIAKILAEGVAERTKDIRDCRRGALMSHSENDAWEFVNGLGREARV